MVIHTLNLIFILANLPICPHRTCGTVVSRILVRGSTNYIKNNIKGTHSNNNNNHSHKITRIALILLLPQSPLLQHSLVAAIIVVILLKSIHPTSDLKIIIFAIASASLMIEIVVVMSMTMMTSLMHLVTIEERRKI